MADEIRAVLDSKRATVVARSARGDRSRPWKLWLREVALAQAADARADAQLHREAPPPLTRAEKKNLEADMREAAERGPPPPPTDQYRRAEIEADQQAWNRLNAARVSPRSGGSGCGPTPKRGTGRWTTTCGASKRELWRWPRNGGPSCCR